MQNLRPEAKIMCCGEPPKPNKPIRATSAYAKWIAAGCPRPNKEQFKIRANGCLECSHRQGLICGLCDCVLAKQILGVELGKLSMATEACPLPEPKWKAIDLDDYLGVS